VEARPVPVRRRGPSLARLEGMASAATRPARVDDDLGVVLNGQWPGPSQAPRAGWPALARDMLAEACLDKWCHGGGANHHLVPHR
jgi:hypothetical protein